MATKVKDISVRVGEYQSGTETKGRFRTIGSLMRSDDGNEFILLDVLSLDSKLVTLYSRSSKKFEDKILCSLFEPRGADDKKKSSDGPPAAAADDDTPF